MIVTDPAGNNSTPVTVEAPDTTAPAPATDVQVAPDGSSVTGNAEPGATVGVDTDGDGQPDTTVVVGPGGSFEVPLNPPLTNGETVTVIVTDPAGNSSTPVTAEAPDFPDAPQVNASNGSVLSGTAEAGVTIVITDGNGNPIGQTSADANGNWSFTPGSQLPDGTVVNVVARDAAGNSSPATSITVDGVAPSAPVVEPSNGSELSGTAEPGSSVTLTDGNGNPIGQTTADANGNWSFTPSTPLPDGTVVNVVARDAAGNSSPPASVTVDAVAPATPTVDPSNGTTLSGTAEPGATVTLTDGNGNPIGQVTADGSGNWTFTPPIIVHPDVRRMLLTMKALNEGGRAFSSYVAMQLDTAKYSEDAVTRKRAEELVALLTPVAKAFLTDMGLETTIHGQQIFGGHGFIREWGQEQLVRDCRITQIYEGTNGIQALDLVGRKVIGSGGAFSRHFTNEIKAFVASADEALGEFSKPLAAAVENLEELTAWLLDRAKGNPNEIGAASVEYLHVFGYTAYAYMWALMARTALAKQGEDDFYASKLGTARFYFARLLPRIHSLSASVRAGSESLYLLDAEQF